MADPSGPGHSSPADVPETSEQAAVSVEARVGGSERARSANLALLALSRAARSFLLYDPGNNAIRRFIEDLRGKMTLALAGSEALRFEVRPFELALDGEVVYVEHEREHSLAFRLYRDGVRKLTIKGSSDWDELLRLLEILSIRYTGVRQNEDDIVTLLWKAGFKHIEIEAVEGFVPDEEDEERGGRPGREGAREAPPDFDLPARQLESPVAPVWRDVPEAAREAAGAEEASHLLAANAAQAAAVLLARAADPQDPISVEELAPFIGEVRDFLLSEGQLEQLTTLVRLLQGNVDLDRTRLLPLIATFGDRRALAQILHSTPKNVTAPPSELMELLDLLPDDRLPRLIDALAAERGEASRRITRQLIERHAQDAPDYLAERLRAAEPSLACDLLRALAGAFPDRGVAAALELVSHADASVADEAFRRIEAAAPSPRIARTLVRLLDSPHEEMRLRVLDLLGQRYGPPVFEPLVRSTETRAVAGLSTQEAERIGSTLARVAPDPALGVFRAWLKPKGLMGRWVETRGQQSLDWVAVTGLGCLPGEEVEKAIRDVSARAGADLRRHCLATLARRRHGDQSRG
jgi:hypothetical protein